ncbi:MAG: diacylglycerol kinase family protein [Dehalobacterium sp.]
MFFIVNPCSANGSTEKWWQNALSSLDKENFDYDWSFTTGPDTAPLLTSAALSNGYRTIVAVGGDGTVYEVLNGILKNDRLIYPDIILGIWARGTGCDLARSLKLPRETDDLINMLKNGKPLAIDAGRCRFFRYDGEKGSRYFLNIAEAGLGSETAARVNQTTKVFGGFFSFLLGALISALFFKNKFMRITLDDTDIREGMYTLVACGNGRYFGGGMKICPEAVIDDGYFDITAIHDIGKLDLIINLPRVYRGTHLTHPKVWHKRAKKVLIQSDKKTLVTLDGELPGVTKAEFMILPRVVRLLIPNKTFNNCDSMSNT